MDFWKISLFITSLTVFRSIIMMISGKLSYKIKKRKPFIVTLALLAPSMAFFVISGQWWLMFIDLLISSVDLGIINNLIVPYILDIAPEDMRRSYTGVYFSFQGVIGFIAGILGGIISDVLVNNFYPYTMAVVLYLIGGTGQLITAFGFFFIDESIKIDDNKNKKVNIIN